MSLLLVYLHGFASGPTSSKAQFFRSRFQELGIELRVPDLGQGDFEGLTISGQLDVLERVAAGQPIGLIGSSMGGYLAALYAASHLEVQRLVLLAPAFAFARRWPEVLGEDGIQKWRQSGFLQVYHYGDKRTRGVKFDLLEDAMRYQDYPEVAQETLIFHGSRDDVVPPQYSARFASNRPNVRLEVLDSDHQLLNVLDHLWAKTSRFMLEGEPSLAGAHEQTLPL